MPELSAGIMYLAESQVALISQQARWQCYVGSVWTRGCEKRAGLMYGGLLTLWHSPLSPCSCASPSILNF